ncbi:MAG: ribosome biogenesis GTPase YlqF [Clostridia bacterium]|nr:ribosome biogenesis GTPase YlqF [Clostridia bacterium]
MTKTNINWYPGHMAKTKRQIIEDLKLIDVVVELLDARLPRSSQNPDLQQIAKDKKKIIILNKCDLADELENKKWVTYFEKNGTKVILTDANSGFGINEVTRQIENIMKDDISKNAAKGRIGKSIRVMILGIPNVGKSSFINRISKKTSAGVGNKPGFTKQKQWIRLSNNIELLDTPGVLWPKFENEKVALNLSFVGTIKDDILEKTEIAFYLLKFLLENYKENVTERYKISNEEFENIVENNQNPNEQIMDIFRLIGKRRGAIVSGGNVDEEKVANLLLDDFRTGRLGRISLEKVK